MEPHDPSCCASRAAPAWSRPTEDQSDQDLPRLPPPIKRWCRAGAPASQRPG